MRALPLPFPLAEFIPNTRIQNKHGGGAHLHHVNTVVAPIYILIGCHVYCGVKVGFKGEGNSVNFMSVLCLLSVVFTPVCTGIYNVNAEGKRTTL